MNFTEARIGGGRLCFAGAGRAALSAPAAAGRSTRNLYQCTSCRRQTSLIAGTIFASTKVPLRTWFRAMYPPDAEQGRDRQPRTRLGVTQNTAWKLEHKLMQVMMERDAGKRLTGRVEIDDASLGGGRSGGKRRRGAPGKTPIIVAMETNARGPAGAPEAAPGRRLPAQGGGKAGPAQPRSPQHRVQKLSRKSARTH